VTGNTDLSEKGLVDCIVRITRAGGFKARVPQALVVLKQ